jgi:haloalkane dehalogenase
VDGVGLHYLDEGEGPPISLMHGNTSWSYLYRKMIPILVEVGCRCFDSALMGFGLANNPRDDSA